MDRQPSGRPGLALPFCSRSREKGPSEDVALDVNIQGPILKGRDNVWGIKLQMSLITPELFRH